MTIEKFTEQIGTVVKFSQIYCDSAHADLPKKPGSITPSYKDTTLPTLDFSLCAQCEELLFYAHERLQNCPHDQKPKCRNCPHICYDPPHLKQMVRTMRGAAIRLGVSKIKAFFSPKSS